jgi:hypothetical protein
MYTGIALIAFFIFIAGYTFGAKNPVKFNENDKMNEETYAFLNGVNMFTKSYNSGELNHGEYVEAVSSMGWMFVSTHIIYNDEDIKGRISHFKNMDERYREDKRDLSIYEPSGRVMNEKFVYANESGVVYIE